MIFKVFSAIKNDYLPGKMLNTILSTNNSGHIGGHPWPNAILLTAEKWNTGRRFHQSPAWILLATTLTFDPILSHFSVAITTCSITPRVFYYYQIHQNYHQLLATFQSIYYLKLSYCSQSIFCRGNEISAVMITCYYSLNVMQNILYFHQSTIHFIIHVKSLNLIRLYIKFILVF